MVAARQHRNLPRDAGLLRAHAAEVGFREYGYLWLYAGGALWERALAKRALQNAHGLGVETLTPADVWARFPLLDRAHDEIVGATFSPRDGLVNPNAVRALFRDQAGHLGVQFRNRHYVAGVATAQSTGAAGALRRVAHVDLVEVEPGDPTDSAGILREILITHRVPAGVARAETRFACDTVVNCLGAWSSVFLSKIGVRDVTEPVRRQVALVDVRRRDLPPGTDFERLGMIVDPSGLYFHPEGAGVLAGYSIPDEAPASISPTTTPSSRLTSGRGWPTARARSSAAPNVGLVRPLRRHAGPERRGRRRDRFRELLRGPLVHWPRRHAVVRRRDGDGRAPRHRPVRALDLSPLRRERFDDPARWVTEDLHI